MPLDTLMASVDMHAHMESFKKAVMELNLFSSYLLIPH